MKAIVLTLALLGCCVGFARAQEGSLAFTATPANAARNNRRIREGVALMCGPYGSAGVPPAHECGREELGSESNSEARRAPWRHPVPGIRL